MEKFYIVDKIQKNGSVGPTIPKGIGFLLLIEPNDLSEWSLYSLSTSYNYKPSKYVKSVSKNLESLLWTAYYQYPPAMAITRELIKSFDNSSKEKFSDNLIKILSYYISNQYKHPFFLAESVVHELGYKTKGEFYWIVEYSKDKDYVGWVSGDYFIYHNLKSDFKIDDDIIKRDVFISQIFQDTLDEEFINNDNFISKELFFENLFKSVLNKLLRIKSDKFFIQGFNSSKDKDFDEALINYKKAIKLDPNNIDIYNNRALIYIHKGDFEKALKDLDKVIKLNPINHNNYLIRGAFYFKKEDYESAIKDYKRALKLFPKYPLIYFYLANAYDKSGELDKAIGFDSKIANLYSSLARLYILTKEYDKSLEASNKFFELNPEETETKENIAHAYLLKGEYKKALSIYKKYFGKKKGDKNFQDVILEDFKIFKEKGIIHSDMNKIEDIIKKYNRPLT